LLKELTRAVIERCLETELDTHLGYQKHGRKGHATGNTRNGYSQKTRKRGARPCRDRGAARPAREL
jgi:putative transposase